MKKKKLGQKTAYARRVTRRSRFEVRVRGVRDYRGFGLGLSYDAIAERQAQKSAALSMANGTHALSGAK